MSEVIKSVKDLLNPKMMVENVYLFSVLSLFLALYGPRLHVRLPSTLRNLFDNTAFRALILFIVGYLASKSFKASLVVSVLFLVMFNLNNVSNTFMKILNVNREKFTMYGAPVAHCGIYTNENINACGNPFYPLNSNPELDNTLDEQLSDADEVKPGCASYKTKPGQLEL